MEKPLQHTHEEIKNEALSFPLVVVCENLHTPENVGMAFRISEAMGAEAIHFSASCPTVSNRKVRQTARNTEKILPHFYHGNLAEALEDLKEEGYTLLGVELAEGSQSLHDVDVSPYGKIALIVGAERNGIEEETLRICDGIIHIPMYGKNSSMNVIHALAISLYEVVKQKQKGFGIIQTEPL